MDFVVNVLDALTKGLFYAILDAWIAAILVSCMIVLGIAWFVSTLKAVLDKE